MMSFVDEPVASGCLRRGGLFERSVGAVRSADALDGRAGGRSRPALTQLAGLAIGAFVAFVA